eukprot:4714284-Pyramimonas_sp.AAC.1
MRKEAKPQDEEVLKQRRNHEPARGGKAEKENMAPLTRMLKEAEEGKRQKWKQKGRGEETEVEKAARTGSTAKRADKDTT